MIDESPSEERIEVRFQGETLSAERGEALRPVLLRAGLSPHNGRARWLNCQWFGTCGTCAVEVSGLVTDPTRVERGRLGFPPTGETAAYVSRARSGVGATSRS